MPAISLLSKTYTYTNGNPNDADEVELDLSNAYANFGTIQTDYNQLVTGAYTIAGVKTFSSPITLSANSNTVAGSLGYSSNVLSYYNGTKRVELTEAINANNYLGGKPPTYTSAATITIPTGVVAMDSTNAALMEVASDQVVSLATSGANGLDTGSEASDTWYYLYLIGSSTDSATYPTKGLFSVTNEAASGSITLPANYDVKRQLPFAVRNDSSSNIIPFYCLSMTELHYQIDATYFNGSSFVAGTTAALSAGTATTFTNVDLTALVPPIAEIAYLNTLQNGNGLFNIRTDGESHTGKAVGGGASTVPSRDYWETASQIIEYRRYSGTAGLYIDVMGYVVTEVA